MTVFPDSKYRTVVVSVDQRCKGNCHKVRNVPWTHLYPNHCFLPCFLKNCYSVNNCYLSRHNHKRDRDLSTTKNSDRVRLPRNSFQRFLQQNKPLEWSQRPYWHYSSSVILRTHLR